MADLFGFSIKRKSERNDSAVSFVPKEEESGTGTIVGGGTHFGSYVDLSGDTAKSDRDLINKYREAAMNPECDGAIDDIVNDAIVSDNRQPVSIVLDEVDTSDKIKGMVLNEFERILELLDFNLYGHDVFRKWYIDGRLPYHIMIDEKNTKAGIQELRYIDPTKLSKVKELEEKKDEKTGAIVYGNTDDYYIYKDTPEASQGLKISKDAIAYCTSGITDASRKRTLSFLHKAIKPVNQLRMMEDSLVIYRISRAPERRIFYIDVGNLQKGKAEEYLRGIMNQYRSKIVYDATTGELQDDKKHMSMLEDFFLPRREGGRGTEISTLPGGENLGQIEDIIYFQKRLYKALNVPVSRMEQDSTFALGRSAEINRDEVKFKKFIDRLRNRFTDLFLQLLKTQLLLKGVITEKDWYSFKNRIQFDFVEDNHYSELKNNEIMRERFEMLATLDEYVGTYISKDWVKKQVLRQDEDQINQQSKLIAKEKKEEPDEDFDVD